MANLVFAITFYGARGEVMACTGSTDPFGLRALDAPKVPAGYWQQVERIKPYKQVGFSAPVGDFDVPGDAWQRAGELGVQNILAALALTNREDARSLVDALSSGQDHVLRAGVSSPGWVAMREVWGLSADALTKKVDAARALTEGWTFAPSGSSTPNLSTGEPRTIGQFAVELMNANIARIQAELRSSAARMVQQIAGDLRLSGDAAAAVIEMAAALQQQPLADPGPGPRRIAAPKATPAAAPSAVAENEVAAPPLEPHAGPPPLFPGEVPTQRVRAVLRSGLTALSRLHGHRQPAGKEAEAVAAPPPARAEVSSVTLQSMEGKHRGEVVKAKSIAEADAALLAWAQDAPKMSDERCEAAIHWANGMEYRFQYELLSLAKETPSLLRSVHGGVLYYTGNRRPSHMSESAYRAAIKKIGKQGLSFFDELVSTCDLSMQEARVQAIRVSIARLLREFSLEKNPD